ncbi:hypothetical protein ACFL52_03585 [Candidatus Margulisiibacteriota bacterium]
MKVKGSGPGGNPAPAGQPSIFPIHGYKSPLSRPGMFYVQPNLSKAFPERQRRQYAQFISQSFTEMIKKEPAKTGFWTTKGIQLSLYSEVLANGSFRMLEKNGQIAGILLFKVYEQGPEAEDRVVRLVNEAVDRRIINPAEFEEFIEEFCKEMKTDLGTKTVISQEKKGDTYLSRVLKSAGFNKVDVSKEKDAYRSYSTSHKYAIYKKKL